MKKFIKSRIGQWLLSKIGAFYIWFVFKTSFFQYKNFQPFKDALKSGRPIILCSWHNRIGMLPLLYKWKGRLFVLTSAHSDGKIIDLFVKNFDVNCVHGSTSRNGTSAALNLLRHLEQGHIIGITPDGPRGPNQKASKGIAQLAITSGALILPITYSMKKHKRLRSWDKFMVPFPFNKGIFYCDTAIDAKDFNDIDSLKNHIESRLNFITDEADKIIKST